MDVISVPVDDLRMIREALVSANRKPLKEQTVSLFFGAYDKLTEWLKSDEIRTSES